MPVSLEQKRAFLDKARNNEFASKVDMLDYLRQADTDPSFGLNTPTVDSSPLSFTPQPKDFKVPLDSFGRLFAKPQQKPLELTPTAQQEKALRERGIETQAGGLSDLKQRATLGLGVTPQAKIDYLKQQGIQATQDPQSGMLLYLNPQTNRYQPVDELGISWGDAAEAISESIPLASQLAFVGGANAFMPPGLGMAATLPAAAAGGAAGKQAQYELGRMAGINENVTPEELQPQVRNEAVQGVAGELGGRLVSKAIGRAITPGSNAGLKPEEAKTILSDMMNIQDEVAAVNAANSPDQQFKLSAGQATQRPSILAKEAETKSLAGLELKAREREQTNLQALKQFEQSVSPAPIATRQEAGDKAEKVFNKIGSQREAKMQSRIDAAEEEARQALDRFHNLDEVGVGQKTRSELERVNTELKTAETNAWTEIRNSVGYDEKTATSELKIKAERGGELDTVLKTLSAETRAALSSTEKSKKKKVAQGRLAGLFKQFEPSKELSTPQGINSVNDLMKAPLNPEKTLSKTPVKLDFMAVKNLISSLKERQRNIKVNKKRDKETNRDITRLIEALVVTRNTSLPPEIVKAIENAEELTAHRKSLFNQGVLAELVRKKGPAYVTPDDAIFSKMVRPNSPSNSEMYAEALAVSPKALSDVRQSIYEMYKRDYTNNGVPSLELHKKFIDRYGDSIEPYFQTPFTDNILEYGKFAITIAKREQQQKVFQEAMRKNSIIGKVENFNADTFAKTILTDKFKLKHAAETKTLLQKYEPETLQALQSSVANEVRRKVLKEDHIDVNALDRILAEKTPHLATLIEPEYVKNLKILSNMARKAGTTASRLPADKGRDADEMAKAVLFHPMSHPGNVARKALKWRYDAQRRALYNLLSDADNLKAFVRAKDAQIGTDKAAGILGILGASILNQPEND